MINKIDVVMPTYNSERFLKPVLDSVYCEIPVCHLILMDGFSTDGTLEIAKQYPNVKIIQTRQSLGKCRELGIKQVDTEWFAFVDSDIVLEEGWFRQVQRHIKPDVGAVEGLDLLMDPRRGAFQTGMVKLRELLRKSYHPKKSKRAFTGDTFIRTELLSDFKFIHKFRHGKTWGGAFADQLIRQHVEDKGFKWVKTEDYVCRHYDFKPPIRSLTSGEFLTFIGHSSLRDAFKNMLTIIPKVLYAFYVTKEWRMVSYQFKWYFYSLKGAIQGTLKRKMVARCGENQYGFE